MGQTNLTMLYGDTAVDGGDPQVAGSVLGEEKTHRWGVAGQKFLCTVSGSFSICL